MDFLAFLNSSVTPYHTVQELKSVLVKGNFDENGLYERNGALIAVRLPKKVSEKSRFRIALAHTDFPALKIAPNPDKTCAGVNKLHVETYGGLLYNSWLDRDLGYAGLLAFEQDGQVKTKLIRGDKLFRIPQLAIHLNRGVNQDGLKVNPQTDLDALWCSAASEKSPSQKFVDVLQAELDPAQRLLDFDVQLFDAQPANIGGFNDEWIYSGRLDNLSSCHAIAEAFLAAEPLEDDFAVAAFMNNEEVGSLTRDGAGGNFLKATLEDVWNRACGTQNGVNLSQVLADSFALSIDMAHAEHPNFPQKHESNHAPILGGGVVLKTNSQKRYASDVLSSARFKLLCNKASVNYQTFITRNDMPCGSTVGPTVSAGLGIPTVDIGEAMLSMHSIREMMAIKDHLDMIRLIKALYC